MLRINCPWCGVRDHSEFTYRGDASLSRPADDAAAEAFHDYLFRRDNPRGWHVEWWHHSGGCRQWMRLVRNTLTHEIHASGWPEDRLGMPPETPLP